MIHDKGEAKAERLVHECGSVLQEKLFEVVRLAALGTPYFSTENT
jgi:hypothetical protein